MISELNSIARLEIFSETGLAGIKGIGMLRHRGGILGGPSIHVTDSENSGPEK